MSTKSREHIGNAFLFGEVLLWSLFPLLVAKSTNILPPLFFAGTSMILAGLFFLGLAVFFQKKRIILPKNAIFPASMGILFILFLFFPLAFFAGQHTSAGNMALIMQTEIAFIFLFFGLLGLERITAKRMLGGALIMLGSMSIVFRGEHGGFSQWDALLLLAMILPPLGNMYQKKVFLVASPVTYGIYRNIIGGIVLCIASGVWEHPLQHISWNIDVALLLVINGVLAFGASKWFFFEGVKRLGVTKSVAISSTAPAITLLLAFLLFGETPTTEQILGLLGVFVGTPLLIAPMAEDILHGKVQKGDGIGKKIGFPTINIKTNTKAPKGVYAAYIKMNGKKYEGIVHCGPRPTFGKNEWRTEIHLLNVDSIKNVPENTEVTVHIIKKIRRIKAFSTRDDLKQALKNDKKAGEEFFSYLQ